MSREYTLLKKKRYNNTFEVECKILQCHSNTEASVNSKCKH